MTPRARRLLTAALLVLAAACEPENREPNPVMFADVTAEAGLEFDFDRARGGGHFMPDSLAGGCAFLDYDGDLDVYVVPTTCARATLTGSG